MSANELLVNYYQKRDSLCLRLNYAYYKRNAAKWMVECATRNQIQANDKAHANKHKPQAAKELELRNLELDRAIEIYEREQDRIDELLDRIRELEDSTDPRHSQKGTPNAAILRQYHSTLVDSIKNLGPKPILRRCSNFR